MVGTTLTELIRTFLETVNHKVNKLCTEMSLIHIKVLVGKKKLFESKKFKDEALSRQSGERNLIASLQLKLAYGGNDSV